MSAVLPELLPVIESILTRRGYADPAARRDFVWPSYPEHLEDPYLLTDMAAAVDRIAVAVKKQQRVVIYGDYDIDGLTASVVLIDALRALGLEASSYIPDRFEEGYGINLEALKKLKAGRTDLVISVDCGITSVQEAAWARTNQLDLIITDHHAVPPEIPEAVAVINPKRVGDAYPFKDLAGVGVAFKLAQALQQRLGRPETGQEKWLLDLVALGTVCDVVPLVGENRTLVYFGLKVLRRGHRPGLVALATVGGIETTQLKSQDLGFVLGPRLNAAGRLEHAATALQLLLSTDKLEAAELAERLNQRNQERRAEQARILEEANAQAALYADDAVLVLADQGWSHGIVGIVASKLVERWHRPVLVMQELGATTKGSARSLGQFNMVEALRAVDSRFLRFGGHHYAAGYTLKTTEVGELRQELNAYARESYGASLEYLYEAPEPDGYIRDLADISPELFAQLELLEPYGNGNPKPLLAAARVRIASLRTVGAKSQHYKMRLVDASGSIVEAIAFGMAESHPKLREGQYVEITFEVVENNFNGFRKLELNLKTLK